MTRLVFTPLAETDLLGILEYIAEHHPLTAMKVVERIRDICGKLRQFPEMGQPRPEFAGSLRSFPIQRWVIFYRVAGDTVEVHRVLDGARDLDSLL
jgi:toxin ParE1/3/4